MLTAYKDYKMKAKISTIIETNENKMWEELQKVSSLLLVASPLLIINPQKGYAIPEKWILGTEYKFTLFFFGIIPLGNHFI